MADSKQGFPDNKELNILIRLVIFIANVIIFIGYTVVHPFEQLNNIVESGVKAIETLVTTSITKIGTNAKNKKNKKEFDKSVEKTTKRKIKIKPTYQDQLKLNAFADSIYIKVTKFMQSVTKPFIAFVSALNIKYANQTKKYEKYVKSKKDKKQKKNKVKKQKPKNKKKDSKNIKSEDPNLIVKPYPKVKKAKPRWLLVLIAFLFGVFFTIILVVVPSLGYFWYKQLPQPELLATQGTNKTTQILDRQGRLLYEIYVDKKYDPVNLNEIPQNVIDATLAIEDSDFYSHNGFRISSIIRAAKETLLEENLQGGSTITQQLIKNVLLTPDRTISRKAKELALAILVEQHYTKNEILELYLNNIPYGGTAYGVQAASRKYFGKDVTDLNLAEAALLAGLPSAPSVYSPFNGSTDLAKQRQLQVLNRMVELGYISSSQAIDAYDYPLEFAPQVDYIRAPHFVEYVRSELYKKYGQRAVDFGGLTVNTTLDLDLQEQVQQIVTEEVANGTDYGFSNGAALVLDSKTGGILAYVGSSGFFDALDGKYDVITAKRQPGSSIKPITYALALENGFTTVSVLNDSPITYQSYGQTYSPKNYDNKYRGNVTLRSALAMSLNIPAVKLVNAVGIDNMVELGTKLGLNKSGWIVGDGSYGLSITLGGKEVRLLDLANVFATFSRQGVYKETTPFISIRDLYGFEILSYENKAGEQVLSQETSYIISNILADNVARTPAFGPNSQLNIPGKTVSVKTGTTNDIRDNLTIGYTPSYTVAVWVGNNDNTPMNPRLASGITGAAPIWNKIMTYILQDIPDEKFEVPEGIIVKTDEKCGNISEVFNKKDKIPTRLCIPKTDKENEKDKNDKNDDKD